MKAQGLHRDDFIWQRRHDFEGVNVNGYGQEAGRGVNDSGVEPASNGVEVADKDNKGKEYSMGQDVSMGLLVPGVKTCVANGATLVGGPLLLTLIRFIASFHRGSRCNS